MSHLATQRLSPKERAEWVFHDKRCKESLATWTESLLHIKRNDLWREQYKTFNEYCELGLGYSRQYVNRLIELASVQERVGELRNACQHFALKDVPEEKLSAVLEKAEELANGKRMTAKILAASRDLLIPKPARTKKLNAGQILDSAPSVVEVSIPKKNNVDRVNEILADIQQPSEAADAAWAAVARMVDLCSTDWQGPAKSLAVCVLGAVPDDQRAQFALAINELTTPADEPPVKRRKLAHERPTIDQIEAYVKEMGMTFKAVKFFDYYAAQGWKLKNGRAMCDWKATCRMWQSRQNEQPPPQQQTMKGFN